MTQKVDVNGCVIWSVLCSVSACKSTPFPKRQKNYKDSILWHPDLVYRGIFSCVFKSACISLLCSLRVVLSHRRCRVTVVSSSVSLGPLQSQGPVSPASTCSWGLCALASAVPSTSAAEVASERRRPLTKRGSGPVSRPGLSRPKGASRSSGSLTRGFRPRREGMPLQPSFLRWRWRWSERTKVLKQLEHW